MSGIGSEESAAMNILQLLNEQGIVYEFFEHEPVMTCEEVRALKLPIPGLAIKNLFLRESKGEQHYLVVYPESERVDLKELSEALGAKKLSFASPDRLRRFLGIEPGAVTMLALINDRDKKVPLYVHHAVASAGQVQCHPLRNDQTVVLTNDGLLKFLRSIDHEWTIIR